MALYCHVRPPAHALVRWSSSEFMQAIGEAGTPPPPMTQAHLKEASGVMVLKRPAAVVAYQGWLAAETCGTTAETSQPACAEQDYEGRANAGGIGKMGPGAGAGGGGGVGARAAQARAGLARRVPTGRSITCHLVQVAFTIACDCMQRHCWPAPSAQPSPSRSPLPRPSPPPLPAPRDCPRPPPPTRAHPASAIQAP